MVENLHYSVCSTLLQKVKSSIIHFYHISLINVQVNDESLEAKRRIMVEQDIMNQAEFGRKRMLMEEGIERQLNKQKVAHTKANLQSIREE